MEPKKTICVDLDGVLADYAAGWRGVDHIGEPIPGAVEFTKRLSEFARVVIFTTRTRVDMDDRPEGSTPESLAAPVKAWLDRHGFDYSEVYTGQGKPIAAAYCDDQAIVCMPQAPGAGPGDEFDMAVEAARALCGE